MIIELEINGARVIVSGENLSVNVSEDAPAAPIRRETRKISGVHVLRDWLKAERGRSSRLAEHLEVTYGAVSNWKTVPTHRLAEISAFTGIDREALVPDAFRMARSMQ
ncbi:hypothetical protein [Sinorhizobium medicae]